MPGTRTVAERITAWSDGTAERMGAWSEVAAVLTAAVVGLVAAPPLRVIVDHHGIEVVLAVLVLAAGLSLPAHERVGLRARARPVGVVVAAGSVALPAVAWLAAHLVEPGPARLGVMALGVAPAEIATVALTTMARGRATTAAALLVASTAATAVLAAPVLALVAGGGAVRTAGLVVTLILVVVVPFGLALAAGGRLAPGARVRAERAAGVAVLGLVALVASQVVPDAGLARVAAALAVVIAGGAVLGLALGCVVPRPDRSAVLLSVSMRDFAVAAGIASAAFGPAAAPPLGLYGVMVMVWGSLVAGRQRRRAVS
jgi:predicted Na+-dependent transporter